jgi:tol-pal system protein YbgF
MIRLRMLVRAILAAMVIAGSAAAAWGQSGGQDSPGFLDGLFGGGGQGAGARPDRLAQSASNELSVRIDRLESQVRQMTGVIEELQYRNQQLADQLRRMQDEAASAKGAPPPSASAQLPRAAGAAPMAAPTNQATAALPPAAAAPPPAPVQGGARRGDAFDPTQNPNAPGAPRTLGVVPGNVVTGAQSPDQLGGQPLVGAPGGRGPGEPLNLSTMNGGGDGAPANGRGPAGGPQVATLPPSDSPRDYYDLAYGYILRKDYALAEDGFRTFLNKYPSDRMAPEAQYWLGESLFQRQNYRDAAESFLNVSTKYESTARAPDALLRLGQSLAALGEKEAACASLGEVLRKYPRAALGVRQGVEREQKRVGC